MIAGPTGTGKSATAVRVAERLGGEIVGCDALQVYRDLDVATAKPTPDERRRVPHHLIDVVDPREDFTVAEYVRRAESAIAGVQGRGRVALVVGGSGMYLRGLLRGLLPAPPRDASLRRRLLAIAERRGSAGLHRWLGRLDPASAERLPPNDTQRIVRGLELVLGGDTPWGERLRRDGTWADRDERYANRKFALDLDRQRLAERLDRRVEAFFAAGLVGEVRRLLDEGVPREANALSAIGYREVMAALTAGDDPRSTIDAVRRNTRRLAKRQRTWLRGEPGVTWLDAAAGPDALAETIVAEWGRTPPAVPARS